MMSFRRLLINTTSLGLLCLSVTACSNAKQTLGINKEAPDEFTVVSRAPLSLPPEFRLRPPTPGNESRPQEVPVTDSAKSAVFGAGADKNKLGAGRSAGETALLQTAIGQTGQIDPNIRALVNQENAQFIESDKTLVDGVIFWKDKKEPGTVLDPKAEKIRIQRTKAEDKPITDGNTPMIERHRWGTKKIE